MPLTMTTIPCQRQWLFQKHTATGGQVAGWGELSSRLQCAREDTHLQQQAGGANAVVALADHLVAGGAGVVDGQRGVKDVVEAAAASQRRQQQVGSGRWWHSI